MILRKRLNPGAVLRIGYVSLIVAAVSKFILRHTSLPENLADGIVGFCYGVSIGTLLLGIWLKTHRRASGWGPPV